MVQSDYSQISSVLISGDWSLALQWVAEAIVGVPQVQPQKAENPKKIEMGWKDYLKCAAAASLLDARKNRMDKGQENIANQPRLPWPQSSKALESLVESSSVSQ